ncbi:MAG: radical SAM protein [Oligoflexia bacterium]|nr:radical SAM protein [Oligoflexia bacterium]
MMFGRRARFRDPIKVVDEIEETHKKYGIKHFVFLDDTLTLRKENIYQLCDELIRRDLDITWEGWTHANTMTEELALKMRKAGLVRLSFGIESGAPEVLKKLRKGTTVERLRAAYRCAKAAGVETRGSVILGLPGDTKESVERTIKFVTSLKDLDHCYFNIASPYPGTEMRNLALNSMEGIRLLSKEYSLLKRQSQSVVMEVNDLDTKTLISLQNKAYLRFWLRPRRILYNIKRQNFVSTIKNGLVFYNSFISPMLKKSKYPFRSEISAIQSLNLKNRDQIAE